MSTTQIIIYALVGGILPALFWLYYWLQEDKRRPEPVGLIFLTFVFGLLSVPAAIVIEGFIDSLILDNIPVETLFYTNYTAAITGIILFAATEEIVKYIATDRAALHKTANDEPIDVMIYLITAALGFSALENSLYFYNTIAANTAHLAIVNTSVRFIGASLLHIASSGILGAFIAFSYYKKNYIAKRYLFTGFIFAITLHTIFNSFIIRSEEFTLIGLATVWISIVAIILVFEKVKKIKGSKVDSLN